MKYIQQSSMPNDEMRIIKTSILILQLFRKGPNFSNYQWEDILQLIESRASGNTAIIELCKFTR